MADLSKVDLIKRLTGMQIPNKSDILMDKGLSGYAKGGLLAQGGDDTPAVIHNQEGLPQAPAAIKTGEIVFSVEAVIGAGDGNYNKGAKILLKLHKQLQRLGEKYLKATRS